MKKIFFIFIILLFSNNAYSIENKKRELNNLFNQLKNTSNNFLAKEIENKIWKIWSTHPTKPNLTDLLAQGSYFMSQNQLNSANQIFSKAIELDSKWAEAWNKRATVLYLMGKYELSQNDINEVLKLEKRHFGALAGQGLVQTALNNYQKAINSYKKVEKIYPSMESPKLMIPKLKDLIRKSSI